MENWLVRLFNQHLLTDDKPMQALDQATLAQLTHSTNPSAARLLLPRYTRDEVRVGVVHLGLGAFHRAHQAMVLDRKSVV